MSLLADPFRIAGMMFDVDVMIGSGRGIESKRASEGLIPDDKLGCGEWLSSGQV